MNHHTRRFHRTLPERGWVQFLILRFIYEKPTHGYQLIEDMESKGYVTPGRFKTGSIYTILNRMEHRGLLSSKQEKSEEGRIRRVYSITPKGTEILKRGLMGVLRRKKIMDKLTKFYYHHFTE
jgi:DNA-binding PadR family transcriptional regulator